MELIITATLAIATLMQISPAGQYRENIGYIFGSWSHSDTVDTSLSLDSGGNDNKDATYEFILAKPSVVAIDNAGSEIQKTCISLTRLGAPISIQDPWEIYVEGADGISAAGKLIEKMRRFYPMASDLDRDIETVLDGQAFLCMELPAGFYALRCEGAETGEDNNGLLTTNFRIYALGATPEESVELGELSGTSNIENLYYTMTEDPEDHDDMYFKFDSPALMKITVDGVGPRGSKGIIELLDSNLNILDNSEVYPRIDGFFPQIRELFIPEGTFYVRVSRPPYGSGLMLFGMNIRTEAPDEGNVQDLRPDTDKNYIVSATAAGPDIKDGTRSTVDYYDGLGRPVQSVMHAGTQDASDIILSSIAYDMFGRKSSTMSPVPSSYGTGAWTSYGDALEAAATFHRDAMPESRTEYTPDPLSRIAAESGPGQEWFAAGSKVNYREYSKGLQGYKAGGSRERPVLEYAVSEFVTDRILVSSVTDEDGKVTRTFSDGEGKVLCKEDNTGRTYYAYDRFGNLCFVLPPQIGGSVPAQEDLDRFAFMYRYDSRNRCIGKKMPGSEWVEYIFDSSDQVIMSQDGNMRSKGEWAVSIPDVFGREAVSGVLSGEPDRAAVEAVAVRATPDMGHPYGYSVNIPVMDRMSITEVSYYDSYDFLALPDFTDNRLMYHEDSSYGEAYGDTDDRIAHKGLVTGKMASLEDGGGCAWDAFYYDYRKRKVQTRRATPEGGTEVRHTAYAYTGEVLEELMTVMPRPGAKVDSIHTIRTYDRCGRLLSEAVEVNGGSPAVTRYIYDAIGRMESVEYGLWGKTAETSYLYNVRDWTTGQLTVAIGDTLFASRTLYNSGISLAGSQPIYGGDISEWHWMGSDGIANAYSFRYDSAGRIADAVLYSDRNDGSSFSEEGISYDRNGNITALSRTNGAMEDGLVFEYDGNRLIRVNGDSGPSGEYKYDANGNMTHDGMHGMDLEFNRMNLIQKVSKNGSVIADFHYLADGTKICTMTGNGTGLEYHGPLTYRNGGDGTVRLQEAAFSGGRFVLVRDQDGEHMEPVYAFRDHLGSTRALAGGDGSVLEQDSYLPFGLRWDDGSPQDPDNRFRFSGKEEQAFAGLPYIDFGARMYDPATGRWLTQDPLAEKYYGASLYAFCGNNPVNIIDPDGRKLYYAKNVSEDFKQKFAAVIKFMNAKGTSGNIARLNDSETIYYIDEASTEGNLYHDNTKTIYWDPDHIIQFDNGMRISPATALSHEVEHATLYDEDPGLSEQIKKEIANDPNKESKTQIKNELKIINGREQWTAKKHGEIRPDQNTRTKHKQIRSIKYDTNGAPPEEVSKAVFEHNNLL